MAYEIFTAPNFTEVDSAGDITVAANKITTTTMRYDAVSWVKKDYGANHFGDFEHEHKAEVTYAIRYSYCLIWGITSNDATRTGQEFDVNADGLSVRLHQNGANANIRIQMSDHLQAPDIYNHGASTGIFWMTTKRVGTAFSCKIYSDAARTVLVDTLGIVVATTAHRYLMALSSRGTAGSEDMSCTSEDLDLRETLLHTPSDSVSISDDVAFKRLIVFSDDVGIDDAIIYEHQIALADSVSISDSPEFKRLLALADSVSISDSPAFKRLLSLADSVAISDALLYKHMISLLDTLSVSDSIAFKHFIYLLDTIDVDDSLVIKHIISLVDSVNITDSIAAKHSIFILDNISILDEMDITGDACGTVFQLKGDSYTVFLPMPEYAGESSTLNNELSLFDFWLSERSLIHIGIESEPSTLSGTIFACSDNKEVEMTAIAIKFLNIHEMMDSNEKITITGLNDCVDAVYVIKDFKYGTIRDNPYAYTWNLTLEYVRAL